MKHLFLLLGLFFFQTFAFGQRIEEKYPSVLHCPTDTFHVKFSNFPEKIPLTFRRDTVDMGTDGALGLSATIYYGKDSLVISYTNLPFAQVVYVPIQTPTKKGIYKLRFNRVISAFSSEYMEQNTGKMHIEIPEVYELANIIWTLSPSGQRAKNLDKESDYYQEVSSYFKPYLNHPLFKKLNFADSLYMKNYYDFRENSFTFKFKGNKLVWEGPYYYVMGNDEANFNSLFKQLAPLVEDFAEKSKFRKFYQSKVPYYTEQINRQKELLPLKNMWDWVENEFPERNFNSYKVVFSPLIGASHSTQNFASYNSPKGWYQETVMFISGPDVYHRKKELDAKQKEGMMSGIVFTEIDHNYVNPISYKYKKEIDNIFSNRNIWTSNDSESNFYNDALSVFNEYMTHAVFCLWVNDKYDKETADFVIDKREALMVGKRNFIRFKEFNRELIRLREKNKTMKVVDLYPAIIEWSKTQI